MGSCRRSGAFQTKIALWRKGFDAVGLPLEHFLRSNCRHVPILHMRLHFTISNEVGVYACDRANVHGTCLAVLFAPTRTAHPMKSSELRLSKNLIPHC